MNNTQERLIDRAHTLTQDPNATSFTNILTGSYDANVIANAVAGEMASSDSIVQVMDSKTKYQTPEQVVGNADEIEAGFYQYLVEAQNELPSPYAVEFASSVCRVYIVKGKLQLAYRIEITKTDFYVESSVSEFTEETDRRQRDEPAIKKALNQYAKEEKNAAQQGYSLYRTIRNQMAGTFDCVFVCMPNAVIIKLFTLHLHAIDEIPKVSL